MQKKIKYLLLTNIINDTIKKVQEQPTHKKNIFAKHISDKKLSCRTRIIKTSPQFKSDLPSVSANKILLRHSQAYPFVSYMWLFSWYKARFNSCNRNRVVHNAWNIHSGPLKKKSAYPWSLYIKNLHVITLRQIINFPNEQKIWTNSSQMKMYG